MESLPAFALSLAYLELQQLAKIMTVGICKKDQSEAPDFERL